MVLWPKSKIVKAALEKTLLKANHCVRQIVFLHRILMLKSYLHSKLANQLMYEVLLTDIFKT